MAVQEFAPGESNHRIKLPLDEANHEPSEKVYRGLARFAHTFAGLMIKRDWRGSSKLPQTGGIIVVSNHMSYADAVVTGEYLIWSGRWPRFLGKRQLWQMPVIGFLARGAGQIPVDRGSANAADALKAAEQALADGKCITMYPEGTLTRDPDLWPMTARTGAARLALKTGVPVIPVAQWGDHRLMPGPRPSWPRPIPRKTCIVQCGDPIDLSDLRQWLGTEREREAVAAATERILDALTEIVGHLRGEPVPEDRWDTRTNRRMPRGAVSL